MSAAMHKQAVAPELMELLSFLMNQTLLERFVLGGGTALALDFGHRSSVDIDLFTDSPFDSGLVQDSLRMWFPQPEVVNRTPGSLCAIVGGVKLDVLLHSYPVLAPYRSQENIRFASLPDLSAMKVNAITNRGSKKDFSDLLLLHEQGLTLTNSLDWFCAKYGEAGRFLALRSLLWFDDAEEEPDPVYLNGWTWPHVRSRMERLGRQVCRENGELL
jgi:hypothetical protein